jgi:hypothetical protein
MSAIAEFKGQNGKLIVHDEFLTISRDTFGGFMSQGGSSGERRYFYRDISAFEFKKPTFIANGYFKVILPGSQETNAKVGLFGSSMDSMKDQNTVVLRAFTKSVGDEAERVYGIVMQKISEAKKQQPVAVAANSKMDELKKLGELKANGILNEEEFQREKEKLLKS